MFLKRNEKLNKKGSALDLIFIAVAAVFFGLVILVCFKVFSEIDTGLQATGVFPSTSTDAVTKVSDQFSGTVDNMFLVFVIGLSIFSLMLAGLVRVHPAFAVFFIMALIFMIFLSGAISNIYLEVAANPNFTAQADQLTFISLIIRYLPLIVGVIGTIMMIIMHKMRSEDI